MTASILESIKKTLNLEPAYTPFDDEVILFVNSALATLNQLGVGPEQGFAIVDADATWDSFIGTDPRWNSVKAYVFIRAKLLFDPPGTSYLINAYEKQAEEIAWRLNVLSESINWVDPDPGETGDNVLDGGSP